MSAYGSSWSLGLDEETSWTKNKIREARNALVNNIRGSLNHDQITDTDRNLTWTKYFELHPGVGKVPGVDESTPFADLRRALFEFSIFYITGGRRVAMADGKSAPHDKDTRPTEVADRKRVLDRLNLGSIYNSDGALTIGHLNGLRTHLDAFVRANDLGNWEDT